MSSRPSSFPGLRRSRRARARSFAFAATLGLAANVALASGGQVILRTDNGRDSYYWNVGPPEGGGRYINEYLHDEIGRGAIVCGARFLEMNQGNIPPPGEAGCDVRLEDPGPFATFPDLSPAGLIATADGGIGACSGFTTRIFSFNGGAGFLSPGERMYVSAIQPPSGTGGLDFCGMWLDTTSTYQPGSAKFWNGTTFGNLAWNQFIELIVFDPRLIDADVAATGSARYPGDRGIKAVFTTRKNAGPLPTDDRITLTIAVDNHDAEPKSRTVRVVADFSVLFPKSGRREITRYFRSIATNEPMNGDVPLDLPVGRTILRVHVSEPAVISKAAAIVGNRVGVNVPLVFLVDDAALDTDPLALEGFSGVEEESQLLGLRRRAGTADDNSMENFFTVQAPNRAGDSLNTRFKALDMPKVAYAVTGFQIVGIDCARDGLGQGLDAIELRTGDPLFSGDPDLSSVGLRLSVGSADGLPDGLTFAASPGAVIFDAIDTLVDPTVNPHLVPDLFVLAQFLPGEVGGPTFVGADNGPSDTLLGDSTFIVSGQHPGTNSLHNWGIRALLDSDLGSLELATPPVVNPNATFRPLTQKDIPLDVHGNVIR